MATSKSGSKSTTKKSTAKKSNRSTTSTKVTTKTVAAVTPKVAEVAKRPVLTKASGEPNYPAIIIAEVIGTFVLTLVALLTLRETGALYVGITVAILVLAVGAVSGAHLNPAVTFGLWSARKLKSILLPVYWIAQFVGAVLAILTLGAFTGSGYPLDFSHFGAINWGVLAAEALGAAIFLFGLVAMVSNQTLSTTGKAFGVGLSLTLGILVSTTALTTLQTSKMEAYQQKQQQAQQQPGQKIDNKIPAELYVKGTTINPAVALASTENTDSQLSGYPATSEEKRYSRLTLEVVIGTFIGAAIGANLYLLLAYAHRQQNS